MSNDPPRLNAVDALAQIESVDDVVSEITYRFKFSRLGIREFAMQAGVDWSTLSRIVHGKRRPSLETALMISYAIVSDEKRRAHYGPATSRPHTKRRRSSGESRTVRPGPREEASTEYDDP